MAEQRPIDANELMNEVDRSERDNPHTDGIARSTHRHEHRHFMAMISDAPTIEAEPRWIPVTEKLPEGSKEDRGAGHAWWSWAFKNSVCMICWMVLAVYFGKWWIALCAVLTATNLRTSHNGGVSAEKCDGQR